MTHTIKHVNTKPILKDKRLTNTGYEVMEDFLWEEGVVQSSKVELQDAGNGVHVMVILVPCKGVLTYIRTGRQREDGVVEKR